MGQDEKWKELCRRHGIPVPEDECPGPWKLPELRLPPLPQDYAPRPRKQSRAVVPRQVCAPTVYVQPQPHGEPLGCAGIAIIAGLVSFIGYSWYVAHPQKFSRPDRSPIVQAAGAVGDLYDSIKERFRGDEGETLVEKVTECAVDNRKYVTVDLKDGRRELMFSVGKGKYENLIDMRKEMVGAMEREYQQRVLDAQSATESQMNALREQFERQRSALENQFQSMRENVDRDYRSLERMIEEKTK